MYMTTLKYRPNTLDKNIYGMIYLVNEYRMPKQFSPNDIIIDIGAHAGYFARTALNNGAGKVFAIEANQENYEFAKENLEDYLSKEKVDLRHAAVWRSDYHEDIVYHNNYEELPNLYKGEKVFNTGSSFVSIHEGKEVCDLIPLDDLLLEASNQGSKRIRFLKIDCEGSEFPILLTAKRLSLVDEISGEYHEPYDTLPFPDFCTLTDKYTGDTIKQYLEKAGFIVELVPDVNCSDAKWAGMGMFYARRISSLS